MGDAFTFAVVFGTILLGCWAAVSQARSIIRDHRRRKRARARRGIVQLNPEVQRALHSWRRRG